MGAMEIMMKSFGINPEEIQKAAGFAQQKLGELDQRLGSIEQALTAVLQNQQLMQQQIQALTTALAVRDSPRLELIDGKRESAG